MGGVTESAALVQRVLGANGRLSTALSGFVPREQQIELALAITSAIEEQHILVAEAGTGTGKTFAYLIPCLLSGKKALISTATKTLQDQLFQKDLPTLIRALGLSVRMQNLKGRANYICRYRVELHAEEGHFQTPQSAKEIIYVREKLPQLTHGERGELPELAEDSPVWPYVTSSADNCLAAECAHYQSCFLVKARKRALEANVVVINHHLYFADSELKQEGFGELLPGVDVVVFDEAHQLPDIASNFHGKRLSSRQLRELMDDILREWPILDLPNQPLKQLSIDVDGIIEQMIRALSSLDERIEFEKGMRNRVFATAWNLLQEQLAALNACFEEFDSKQHPGLTRCKERLDEMQQTINLFLSQDKTQIRWIERFKQNVVFHSTPYEMKETFQAQLTRQKAAYVFTSATLTMAQSFECFTSQLGLIDAKTLYLESPFDFKEQALLYLPRGLPDPKDSTYYEVLVARALNIMNACGGRSFFLFTSHRALKEVANLIKSHLNFPLLIQGDEAKPILLARFRNLGNAVLLGTATFWEGVDVKGEALSCVIIDKLPFANPTDPVIRGKMAYLKSRGLSGFDSLSLPNAVLALKQGVGRLIRDAQDKGILMIADPRLTSREYGRQILASLPHMQKSRDEKTVLTFIQSLGLTNEHTSTGYID